MKALFARKQLVGSSLLGAIVLASQLVRAEAPKMLPLPGATAAPTVSTTASSLPSGSQARGRVSASGDLVVRGNPGGAIVSVGLAYRRTYQFDDQRQIETAALMLGLGAAATGAFAQGGPFIEWMPALPLQIRLQYDVYGFFGANGSLLSFPSATSEFGSDAIEARAGTEERAIAHRVLLRPTLRMRIGRVVVRNQTDIARYHFGGSGPYFFDREYDTLLRNGDHLVSSRTGLLLVIRSGKTAPGLVLGPAYEVTRAWGASLTRQRIGIQGSWIPDLAGGSFSGFRLYGMAGVNLQDRNRRHEPFVMVGVGTDVNL